MAKANVGWQQELAEQILGQMIFAAGSGSGGQWVAGDAISEIRAYFSPFVLRVIGRQSQGKARQEWKEAAVHILHYMDTIGRLAAQRSIAACQYWIDGPVMADAIRCVVADVNSRTPAAGRWCGAI
jgi:hypothetical protein